VKCFKCKRTKCLFKIICYAHNWEYAACFDHRQDLEKKSNLELGKDNGILRGHYWSTVPLPRELIKARK